MGPDIWVHLFPRAILPAHIAGKGRNPMAKASEARQGRDVAETTVPSIEPFLEVGSKLLETWAAVGTEILEFSKTRLDQNLELSRAIAKTGSVTEAMDVQARFTREMMQEYIAEANKIADMSTRSFLDTFATAQKQTQTRPSVETAHAAE
jgi:hypothetical protein